MSAGRFLPERIGVVLKHPLTSSHTAARCSQHCWTTVRSPPMFYLLPQAHLFRWRCLQKFPVPYFNLPDQLSFSESFFTIVITDFFGIE